MNVEDGAEAPVPPASERLRDLFWTEIGTLTLGLVTSRARRLRLGPFVLLAFGPPQPVAGGFTWSIEGGLLARRPTGRLEIAWADGRLHAEVADYEPRLPRPLYRLAQEPIHHLVTRLFLLRLRGSEPLPAPRATRPHRLAAAALDLGLCGGAVALWRPRRAVRSLAGLVAGYLMVSWALAGGTPGERAAGIRIAAWDGRRLLSGQALLRLLGGGRVSATAAFLRR